MRIKSLQELRLLTDIVKVREILGWFCCDFQDLSVAYHYSESLHANFNTVKHRK